MKVLFRARCERVRYNNGIVEAFFTRPSDPASHEEHVLVNVKSAAPPFREGLHYVIEIQLES